MLDLIFRLFKPTLITLCAFAMMCSAVYGAAADQEWRQLDSRIDVLLEQENLPEAFVAAQGALRFAEAAFKDDDLNIATSLNKLALVHRKRKEYLEADSLYKRALTIFEKNMGSSHPALAKILNEMAEMDYERAQYPSAEAFLKRAINIRENASIPDDLDIAEYLNNLAIVHDRQSRHADAEPLYRRALLIREKVLGPNHLVVAEVFNNLAIMYYRQGQYANAEPLYLRALEIREANLGTAHPKVAEILQNLALVYVQQSQYSKAGPRYKRALEILEKSMGPDHPGLVRILNEFALLYERQIQYAAAEPLYKRVLAIREKSLGSEHRLVALTLHQLADLYFEQSQYDLAESCYRRALAIREKILGQEHLEVAQSLNNLARLYRRQAQYASAEALYHRALAIREKLQGPDHPNVAQTLSNLAVLYEEQAQYAKAELLYERALTIREKALGPDHPDVAVTLSNQAGLFETQARYDVAERLYRRALGIYEKKYGSEHPDVATILNNLAFVHEGQAKYSSAELLFKRALALREKHFGPNHLDVAQSLSNLAGVLDRQMMHASAELLETRALAIRETILGPDHPAVAKSLSSLGSMYEAQAKYESAEPLFDRALKIREKIFGSDHPTVAVTLNNKALLYENQKKYEAAEPLYQRALEIDEKFHGPDHPHVAIALNNLGYLYSRQEKYVAAEPLYKRSLSIQEKFFGKDHITPAITLANLGWLYSNQQRLPEALDVARRSGAIIRQRVVQSGLDDSAPREAASGSGALRLLISLLAKNIERNGLASSVDESLQTVQVLQTSSTTSAVAKMAARFASGSDELAQLARRKQDLSDEKLRTDKLLVGLRGQASDKRNQSRETELLERLEQIDRILQGVNADLKARFPAYQELTQPQPLSLADLQPLLRSSEAMLVYHFSADGTFAWVITPNKAHFVALNISSKTLAEHVTRIRYQMELDETSQAQPVSLEVLHELYQSLVEPLSPHLADVAHVLVVPDGPLQSLPLGILVASKPPQVKDAADYRQVEWLAKRFAISVLPSVGSIRAFRQFAKARDSYQEPFAGFGDPLLSEESVATRGMSVARAQAANKSTIGKRGTGTLANVEAIRAVPRLPETADELQAMASTLNAPRNRLWLRDRATESEVKKLDLTRYRTVAFATHGMMAGEIQGVSEPGLILTPPQTASTEDDGYLSAGEVAQLSLNADWVILSACNTAAADGSTGAEGLSGLAKAFFYAGARSLLVSHWPVASQATVPLTTVMLKIHHANASLGKAEAHRQSMLQLLNTPDQPHYAHPAFWAPFIVVGEGGP